MPAARVGARLAAACAAPMCAPTSADEHAVSTDTAGPVNMSKLHKSQYVYSQRTGRTLVAEKQRFEKQRSDAVGCCSQEGVYVQKRALVSLFRPNSYIFRIARRSVFCPKDNTLEAVVEGYAACGNAERRSCCCKSSQSSQMRSCKRSVLHLLDADIDPHGAGHCLKGGSGCQQRLHDVP